MQKNRVLSFLILSFLLINSVTNAQKQNASDYLSKVNKEFKEVSENTWDYTSSAAHGKKAKTVENKRKLLVSQITSSIFKISHMKDFGGSSALRDSATAYLQLSKHVINEDYSKIMDMEEISEQSYDAMEAYMLAKEKANEKLNNGGAAFELEYKKFADNNNITLIEGNDKLSKKLVKSGEVYNYYNKVYLIFFKSYKQEAYMIDAQNNSDFNAMEQNKNALLSTSTEGLIKIKDIKPYEGDMSLKQACNDMLKFFENEAKKYSDVSNFYIVKENFDKLRIPLEAKKQNERTKEEIDLFNKNLKVYNDASAKFNKLNNEFNNNRNQLLARWNESSEKFVDRHVPKK